MLKVEASSVSQPHIEAPAAEQAPAPAPADVFEKAPRRQWAFARQDNDLAAPRAAREVRGRGHDGCCEILLCSSALEACCLWC